MMTRRVVVTAVASFSAFLAHSEVRIELEARASTGTPDNRMSYSFTDAAGVQANGSVSLLGSSAVASADLRAGSLRAFAKAANDDIGAATTSSAVFADNFEFSGGYGGTAYLDYVFEGQIDVEANKVNPNTFSYGGMLLYLAYNGTSFNYGLALAPGDGVCGALNFASSSLGCFTGMSIRTAGSIPIEIGSGSYYFLHQLSATATAGDEVNFGNTARFNLRLPDGVSISSSTGEYLTAAAPVPEPETYAMLLVGLGVVGAAVRRRKAKQA